MENTFEKIVNYYLNASTDQYGQMSCIGIYCIINGNDAKQLEDLESLVYVSTYGGRFGPYKAFMPWGSFKCAKLESECKIAFKNNQNYKRNMTQW
jgi:hypothetical protein